jgi:hypothetical protein
MTIVSRRQRAPRPAHEDMIEQPQFAELKAEDTPMMGT